MITEDYVSFEIAKLLKKKGFYSEDCFAFYKKTGEIGFFQTFGDIVNYNSEPCIIAPTLQMVMKWLREIHYLHIEISIGSDSSIDADGNTLEKWYYWTYLIRITTDGHMIYSNDCLLGTEYQSYEDAVEAAIKYCLENLINT